MIALDLSTSFETINHKTLIKVLEITLAYGTKYQTG